MDAFPARWSASANQDEITTANLRVQQSGSISARHRTRNESAALPGSHTRARAQATANVCWHTSRSSFLQEPPPARATRAAMLKGGQELRGQELLVILELRLGYLDIL